MALGQASEQEKIDAAGLAAVLNDVSRLPDLLKLLEDESENVRYFVLEDLVVDLDQVDEDMEQICWRLLTQDEDEDVRSMAASCLGKIYFNRRSRKLFRRALQELKSPDQANGAKGTIYSLLFKSAGKPPSEWPGLDAPREWLLNPEIDWIKVAELEDSLDRP